MQGALQLACDRPAMWDRMRSKSPQNVLFKVDAGLTFNFFIATFSRAAGTRPEGRLVPIDRSETLSIDHLRLVMDQSVTTTAVCAGPHEPLTHQ